MIVASASGCARPMVGHVAPNYLGKETINLRADSCDEEASL